MKDTTNVKHEKKKKINKAQLITDVARETDSSKEKTAQIIGALLRRIEEGLIDGYVVGFPNLGTVRVIEKKERTGTQPSTGERIIIPPSRTISVKPAPRLRKKLNGHADNHDAEVATPQPAPNRELVRGPKAPNMRPPAGSATKKKTTRKRAPSKTATGI